MGDPISFAQRRYLVDQVLAAARKPGVLSWEFADALARLDETKKLTSTKTAAWMQARGFKVHRGKIMDARLAARTWKDPAMRPDLEYSICLRFLRGRESEYWDPLRQAWDYAAACRKLGVAPAGRGADFFRVNGYLRGHEPPKPVLKASFFETPEDQEQFRQESVSLYEAGSSVAAVAERLAIPGSIVYGWVKEAGVVRSGSEAQYAWRRQASG
ncbi:MAG: hypothetical protein H0T54_07480 [Geodermatophilaceae bacterium]|nr:hypothetical protein [Geodermatophilaceae bacterium]